LVKDVDDKSSAGCIIIMNIQVFQKTPSSLTDLCKCFSVGNNVFIFLFWWFKWIITGVSSKGCSLLYICTCFIVFL